jgi:drug/metabolite transporter (DMT)-like permease
MWVLLGGFSGLTLGFTDLASKIASRQVGAISVLLTSNIIGAFFIITFCILRHWFLGDGVGQLISFDIFLASVPKNALMVGSLYAMYLSLPHIALSYAGAIRASGPIWTLMGAWILTREALTTPELLCLAASVVVYLLYAVIGRRDGIGRIHFLPLVGMTIATISSSLVTAYDKFLAVTYGVSAFDTIQVSSAVQRVLFAYAIFVLVKGQIRLSKAVAFNGVAWAIAEYAYFFAYSDPNSKATILAVLRRLSLVSGLAGSAVVFGEKHLAFKIALCCALVLLSAIIVSV